MPEAETSPSGAPGESSEPSGRAAALPGVPRQQLPLTQQPWSRRSFLQAAGVAPIALAAAQPARSVAAPAGTEAISRLTAEYSVTPLGVDVARPRLGWMITTRAPGWRQAAYQVRVASSEDMLSRGAAD